MTLIVQNHSGGQILLQRARSCSVSSLRQAAKAYFCRSQDAGSEMSLSQQYLHLMTPATPTFAAHLTPGSFLYVLFIYSVKMFIEEPSYRFFFPSKSTLASYCKYTRMRLDHTLFKTNLVGVCLDYQLIAFNNQINCRIIFYIPLGTQKSNQIYILNG